MRIGTNPEKTKETKLIHKPHRIIMPFWIPNVEEDYFKNQPEVLRLCLQSLTETIDNERTNITLINNNSCPEASKVAEEFVGKGLIDKYIVRSENRGKLENILAEARAAYEDYITISDADFLFFKGWENKVAKIFCTFKRAGVVTIYPCPNLSFQHNTQWLLTSFWNWKSGSVVEQQDMNLVDQGLGHQSGNGIYKGLGVKKKYQWSEKQYYLKKGDETVCFGAVHALATMKKDIFTKLPIRKIEHLFRNGYEEEYLDYFSDKLGYYRVSTTKCYAYHLGNSIPDDKILKHELEKNDNLFNFPPYKERSLCFNRLMASFTNIIVRVARKFNMI